MLRVLAQITYRPALLYIDTLKYLYNAWPGTDPLGYKGVLKAILLVGNLQMGHRRAAPRRPGMGVAIYAVLLRRGAPRWLAALAAAPVLLDAYELQTEQTIMPDVWFEALIVAALVVLLWRPRPTPRAIALAGLALGLSVTVGPGGRDPDPARRDLRGDLGRRLAARGRRCGADVRRLRCADPGLHEHLGRGSTGTSGCPARARRRSTAGSPRRPTAPP